MMKLVRRTVGVPLLTIVLVTPGPAQAANSDGPYYATPSWDQQLECDATATCPRLIVLSNWFGAAVLDRETGLVWEQTPGQGGGFKRPWFEALEICANLTVGGRQGWRSPS